LLKALAVCLNYPLIMSKHNQRIFLAPESKFSLNPIKVMYKNYFPKCPVDGPIEPPVPFGHLASHGAVPNKCSKCQYLFEGECTRYIEDVGHYLELDHGYCGIPGATDPVIYEDSSIVSKVEIPRKCASCRFLELNSISGFICRKDRNKWGDFQRGLDWGTWEPDFIYLELPAPKLTTKALMQYAYKNDLLKFIKEYRRINPGLSIEEAKNDFQRFSELLEKWTLNK
jgi:hypothetical protein